MDALMQELIRGLVIILGALISYGVTVGVAYIKRKEQAVAEKVGQDRYEANKRLALDLVRIVEEKFLLGELIGSKLENFEAMIAEKVPYLTKGQIEELRHLAVKTFDEEMGK